MAGSQLRFKYARRIELVVRVNKQLDIIIKNWYTIALALEL